MGISKTDQSFSHDADPSLAYRASWIQLTRPMTLTGTISPILAGTGFAAMKGAVHYDLLIILLIAAVLVQASANMLNDYFDVINGQDHEKWQTGKPYPLGKVPVHNHIPYIVGLMIVVAIFLGAWLSIQSNWIVAVIGTIGLVVGYAYSAGKKSLAALGLGEIVAALFLGVITTLLSYIIQGYSIDGGILGISLPFALLIASMILTNNIRDIKKDLGFRRTLAIRLGRIPAWYLLIVILVCVYVWVLALVSFHIVPWAVIGVFFALPFAFRLVWSFRRHALRIDEINGMKWAARHHWVFGVMFAFGLFFGAY